MIFLLGSYDISIHSEPTTLILIRIRMIMIRITLKNIKKSWLNFSQHSKVIMKSIRISSAGRYTNVKIVVLCCFIILSKFTLGIKELT